MHYQRLRKHGDPNGGGRRAPDGAGTTCKTHGYRLIRKNGRQNREHVLVAEQALGHPLPPGAVVHHVDLDKTNNTPTNLVVCPDDAYHALLHQRQRALDAGAPAHWRRCAYCKQYDEPDRLYIKNTMVYHVDCANAYRRNRYHAAKATKETHV